MNTPRIWIDCTDTYRRGTRTGIQRVVRNLVSHGQEVDPGCRPVIFGGATTTSQRWYAVDWDPRDQARRRPGRETRFAPQQAQGLGGRLKRLALGMAQAARAALKPLWIGEIAIDWLRQWRLDRLYRRIDFQPGDILLLPDAMWNYRTMPDYESLRKQGVKIILLVYDLIPIDFPRFVHPMSARWFRQWLDATVPQVDGIVAISRTVRDSVRKYVADRFHDNAVDPSAVESFAMGVELDESAVGRDVRQAVRAAEGGYLFVSTLEPRKNHRLLLDAFERVWQRFSDARLCIAGQEGWLVADLVERIRSHPRLGRQLWWFDDLTDTELIWIYGHAKALVFPSLAEGYGLPIAEALLHGLPVLASDTPIHREVAGEFAVYFDPEDSSSLAGIIEAWESGAPVLPPYAPAAYRATTWNESATELLAQCRRISCHSTAKDTR